MSSSDGKQPSKLQNPKFIGDTLDVMRPDKPVLYKSNPKSQPKSSPDTLAKQSSPSPKTKAHSSPSSSFSGSPSGSSSWNVPKMQTALVLTHEEPIFDVKYDVVEVTQLPMDCQVKYKVLPPDDASPVDTYEQYGELRTKSPTGSLISWDSMASFDRVFYSANDEPTRMPIKKLKAKPNAAKRVESTGFEVLDD